MKEPSRKKNADHEKDFFSWTHKQSEILKQREFSKLDVENLIEEIESLGRSEKRTLQSYLEVLLMHMLKAKFQPEKYSRSWELSIKNSRIKARQVLDDSPSLKPKLSEIIKKSYESARLDAAQETELEEKTFPKRCPWTINEIFLGN
jgi:Domain of unknown function DUF29